MITPTQELLRAEKHIDNGDYETARKILSALDDPTAREWLAELDKIAPVKQSPLAITCGISLWLFFVAVILFILLTVLSNLSTVMHLNNNGEIVDGVVIDRYRSSGYRSTSNILVYTFVIEDVTYTNESLDVGLEFYNAHPENSTVTILYNASDPDISMIQGTEQPIVWIIFIPTMTAILGYLLHPIPRYFVKMATTRRRKQKRKATESVS